MEYILAFLKAIGSAAESIKKVFDLVKTVQDFAADPSGEKRNAYLNVQQELRLLQEQLQDAVQELAETIVAALDAATFEQNVRESLVSSNTAVMAHDLWKRLNDQDQRSVAITESGRALNRLVLLMRDPRFEVRIVLVFVVVEIMAARLAVLRDADPEFAKSGSLSGDLREVVAYIREVATRLEDGIRAGNKIQKSTTTRAIPVPGGLPIIEVTYTLSYANVSGSVRRTITFSVSRDHPREGGAWHEDPAPLLDAAQRELEGLMIQGVAEDLAAARVAELRQAADVAAKMISESELLLIGRFVNREISPLERTEYLMLRKGSSLGVAVDRLFAQSPGGAAKLLNYDALVKRLNKSAQKKSEKIDASNPLLRRTTIGALAEQVFDEETRGGSSV